LWTNISTDAYAGYGNKAANPFRLGNCEPETNICHSG
jgi:hypothetical protein